MNLFCRLCAWLQLPNICPIPTQEWSSRQAFTYISSYSSFSLNWILLKAFFPLDVLQSLDVHGVHVSIDTEHYPSCGVKYVETRTTVVWFWFTVAAVTCIVPEQWMYNLLISLKADPMPPFQFRFLTMSTRTNRCTVQILQKQVMKKYRRDGYDAVSVKLFFWISLEWTLWVPDLFLVAAEQN